jgi:hypothetical protein
LSRVLRKLFSQYVDGAGRVFNRACAVDVPWYVLAIANKTYQGSPMKTLFAITLVLFTANATAGDIFILCTRGTGSDCAPRVEEALNKMGCAPVVGSAQCQVSESNSAADACLVQTLNCEEPRAGLIFSTSCDGSAEAIPLKKFDRGLTLTWWMAWGPYVRYVCKN